MPAVQKNSVTLSAAAARAARRLAEREKRPMRAIVADAVLQYEAAHPGVLESEEDWARFIEQVKSEPMTDEELRAEFKHITKVISGQAKRLGIRERDIDRIIHESRAARRAAASRARH
jgi:hypothetical protein